MLHCKFSEFIPPSDESIKNIISSFPNKACSLHLIPAYVFKDFKDTINFTLPIIGRIVEQFFSSGIFPASLKTSQVRPKLKNRAIETDLFASYRSIANIPFVSKKIEKSAATCTQDHNYSKLP